MINSVTVFQEVEKSLIAMSPEFKMALPAHVTPEKFLRVAINAIKARPELLNCNRQSLYKAISDCAKDGLLADGREAIILAFGNEAGYLPMIEGVIKTVRNSGELATINAEEVFEHDKYDSWVDERGQHFEHRKARGDRGKPVLTYAYAITKDGALYFEEIDEQQMAAIENMARSKNIWKGPFRSEMKRKSALHRLSKRLPKSTDLDQVIHRDDDLYELPSGPVAPAKPTSSRLDTIIDAQSEPQPDVSPESSPEQEPLPTEPLPAEKKTAEGVVEECKFKSGEKNGKKWTKYGVKIGGEWYGTFDSKIYEQCLELKSHGNVLCYVEYTENKFGREIGLIRAKTTEEMNIPI